jgi:MiaB-like tRNA modifying enzyme
MKSVYIETYGCSANQSEYEILSGLLLEKGFRVVDDVNKSDINIILTCAVKTPTSNRMAYRIKKLTGLNKPLVVAGCMPEIEYERIKSISHNASLISTNHLKEIPRMITKIMKGKRIELVGRNKIIKVCLPKIRKNPVVNITQISSGCRSLCSYCCVKQAKGDLFSYPPEMILNDVERSVKDGCKEVWITSQDCGCYGLDIGSNLAELLGRVVRIKGDFRVRVGMMNTVHVKPILGELIKVYKHPKIYKFIHVPVQAGSDRVLREMKRGYKAEDFEGIVKEFRKSIPDITLSTDVIAGFPGERGSDFRETFELIKSVRPDIVNVSKFGARPGTEAARMKQVDNKIIKERSKKMARLVRKITSESNREWVGKECEILVNERGKRRNQFMGRNESYKPVIVQSEKNLMGRFLKVKIIRAGGTYVTGEPLSRNSV